MTVVANSVSSTMEPPSYTTVESNTAWDVSEKRGLVGETNDCAAHGHFTTPNLDKHLQQPQAKVALQAIISALNDVVNDEKCTKCATEEIAKTTSAYIRELKAAKKNGEFAKEDKKALKTEVKALFKSVKGDLKAAKKESKR